MKQNLNIRTLVTILGIAALAMMTDASATSAIDSGLNDASNNLCKALKSIESSKFVGFIGVAMFFGGLLMIWLKQRGGLGMCAFGLIGYFVVKNSTKLATGLGFTACP